MTRQFFYHALGVGLAGRITRPFCDVVEAQAATSLATIGGSASSRVDAYRFRDIVSVRSARIHAFGSETGSTDDDRAFHTSVTVTVEGLNILDVITADSITARLASRHPSKADQPQITAVGTEIRGLRIGGHAIDLEVDRELFCQERNYEDFKGYVTSPKNIEGVSKRFLWGRNDSDRRTFGEAVPQGPAKDWPESKGRVVCSLVKRLSCGGESLEARAADLKPQGYVIRVPTVGWVILGETVVSPYARRLTMVRVELGSPAGGRLEACSIEVNGSTFP